MVVGAGNVLSSTLTRKNGIKVGAGSPCSVEDVCLAVGKDIGYGAIKSAARMNGAVVLFVEKVEQAQHLVEVGVSVNGLFLHVSPLTLPATKITLSNVPPFISDEFLIKELSRHGKVVSPIRKVLSGCKSPLLKHVVSHRRQLFMLLNRRDEELDLRFHVKVDGFDYVLFATSSHMKCFGCGQEGHIIKMCPGRAEPAQPASAEQQQQQPAAAERDREPLGEATAAEGEPTADAEVPAVVVREDVDSIVGTDSTVEMSVCENINESSVLSGDGENGEKGEGVQKDSEQREQERVRGEKEQLAGGAQGEQREMQVDEQDEGKSSVEGVEGDVVEKEKGLTDDEREVEASAPIKRRSKRKNVVAAAQASKQACKLTADKKDGSDSSDAESWFSDTSDVSVTQSSTKEPRYPVEAFRIFLRQTKGLKGVKLESYFPNLRMFYFSARYHIRNRELSGFADTEVFRLKKIMSKVRKQF
ncbi:uncharacterized protein LOC111610513 [Xiphophorus maculatus]|uniref:uncharacterized protein LOC111608476 n=1 Tax=Xiphophorus maculatus TaxID=8083 RepID=UPI000C6D5254|nr:uncharacterized protein LOC111608476 [Xiphophorus maculatus]XP_023200668.1 uncharacterized protein LOC111610513 [Xiphophorus maculatus]